MADESTGGGTPDANPSNREDAYDEDSGTGIGGNVTSGDAESAEALKQKNLADDDVNPPADDDRPGGEHGKQ